MLTSAIIYLIIGMFFLSRQIKSKRVGSAGHFITYAFALFFWPFHAFSIWLEWFAK